MGAPSSVDGGGRDDRPDATGELDAAVDDAAAARDAGGEATDAATPLPDAAPSEADAAATTGSCPAGATLCEGFERGAGELVSPSCSGSGRASLDAAVSRSGGQSLRVDGGGGYCDHVFSRIPLADHDGPLHVRFHVRLSAPLGAGHTTFAALRDETDGRDLRLGGQNAVVVWNREIDDATLPELSPAGTASSVALAAGEFHCVEIAIDASAGTLRTRVDGVEVEGLVSDGEPTHDRDAQWQRRAFAPRLSDLRLGWESYAGQALTVWFDDVAVGTAPLGCD